MSAYQNRCSFDSLQRTGRYWQHRSLTVHPAWLGSTPVAQMPTRPLGCCWLAVTRIARSAWPVERDSKSHLSTRCSDFSTYSGDFGLRIGDALRELLDLCVIVVYVFLGLLRDSVALLIPSLLCVIESLLSIGLGECEHASVWILCIWRLTRRRTIC